MLYCVCVWRSTLQDKPTLHRPLSLICRSRGTKRGQSTNKEALTDQARPHSSSSGKKQPSPTTGHYRWVPAGARLAVHNDTPAGTPLPISLSSSSSSSSISLTHKHTSSSSSSLSSSSATIRASNNQSRSRKKNGGETCPCLSESCPNSTHSDSHLHACRRVVVFQPVSIGPCRRR